MFHEETLNFTGEEAYRSRRFSSSLFRQLPELVCNQNPDRSNLISGAAHFAGGSDSDYSRQTDARQGLSIHRSMQMKIILGSQSPRRKELLSGFLGDTQISVVAPQNSQELEFDGLRDLEAIEERLMAIVSDKINDVREQVALDENTAILCADTTVVVRQPDGSRLVLGKPPATSWQQTTARWFQEFYSGKTHEVWTGFQIVTSATSYREIVRTSVSMPPLNTSTIQWYVSTEEPIGKAGGYGIQGQAAVLISNVDGSLSNVIGLPVLEVVQALERISAGR